MSVNRLLSIVSVSTLIVFAEQLPNGAVDVVEDLNLAVKVE